MLLGKNATFKFSQRELGDVEAELSGLRQPARGRNHGMTLRQEIASGLMEQRREVLACYFNLVTAMSQIHLPVNPSACEDSRRLHQTADLGQRHGLGPGLRLG